VTLSGLLGRLEADRMAMDPVVAVGPPVRAWDPDRVVAAEVPF
jgi:hypothetical protein